MSSLLDAVIQSDAAEQDARSEASSHARRQVRSSSRPQGPPSIGTPGLHSDAGFEDDQLVGAKGLRRQGPAAIASSLPPVMDVTAEQIAQHFQSFLEE